MRNLRYFKILTFSGYVSQNSRTATTGHHGLAIEYLKVIAKVLDQAKD